MYIKRKDAMEVIYKLDFCLTNLEYFAHNDLIRAIPAADVVEVVRCKDCKYYAAMVTDTVSGDMETAPWGICIQPWFNSDEYDVQENGYCSYGERRMDKEE